jgi:hypothetical protein
MRSDKFLTCSGSTWDKDDNWDGYYTVPLKRISVDVYPDLVGRDSGYKLTEEEPGVSIISSYFTNRNLSARRDKNLISMYILMIFMS